MTTMAPRALCEPDVAVRSHAARGKRMSLQMLAVECGSRLVQRLALATSLIPHPQPCAVQGAKARRTGTRCDFIVTLPTHISSHVSLHAGTTVPKVHPSTETNQAISACIHHGSNAITKRDETTTFV